jgi:4-amino-4-deoxy-L-arabinose transferase-like glycosyltransferase
VNFLFRAIDTKGKSLTRSQNTIMLLAAALLFLAQALPLLNTRWVEDESWYAASGGMLAKHGDLRMRIFAENFVTARVDTRPPLTPILIAACFRILGTTLYSAKTPFLLAALAGIFLTYLLGCELRSPLLGLIGAVFLAADNIYMVAARTVRPEPIATAFALAGILLFLRSLGGRSPGLAFLSGIAVGVGLLAHINAFSAAISIFILAVLEYGWTLIRRARPWAFLAGFLLALVPFFVWVNSDAVHREEFINMYSQGEQNPASAIPRLELSRWSDFIGLPNSRFPLPVHLPYRLHVGLALAAAVFLLIRFDRPLLKKLACFILPCVVWYAYERNPTSRYIATAAPFLSLLLGGGLLAAWTYRPQWRRLAMAAAVLVLLTEVGSNYFVEYVYRKANYTEVTRQLRALIPPDAPVYAALTFWMSFPDRPFYAWNRTPVQYAVDRGAAYLILNDRVLVNGSGFGLDDWADRRREMADFVSRHATLVGRAPNSFYGDLEVYRVNGR